MTRTATACSFLLTLIWVTTSFGQVKLERKYVEGTTYTAEMTSQVDQTLTIVGMPTETGSDTKVVTKVSVGKRDNSGTLRIAEKVDQLQVKTSVQGLDYNFDSNMPDTKGTSPLEMLREVHKAMINQTSTTVLDQANQIKTIEFDQNVIAALAPEVKDLIKSQLDPEYLKQVANQQNARLPTDAVNKGDNWLRTENANFGAGQEMTFQVEYTYQGTTTKDGKTLDRITSKVLSVMFALKNSPLPLTLKNSDLKGDSQGEVLFDREKGRIVESHTNTKITGALTFAVADKELPATLNLKLNMNSVERP